MSHYLLERRQVLRRDLDEVFAFFADARNLVEITPPFLDFEITTQAPIEMRSGALIDYRIKLFGVPVRWRTEIESFDPGVSFVDRQLRGPYRWWRHTHTFTRVPEGTLMCDEVDYDVGFGPLGSVARALFVRRTLQKIFDYRAAVVAKLFDGLPAHGVDARI